MCARGMLLFVVVLAGCADGAPLSTCEHGLYWADCGGEGEPVLACSLYDGRCRWFLGGVVAGSHVASSCPADDLCCAENWAFPGWTPDMSIRERIVTDLGVLRAGPVVTPSALGTLDVVVEDVPAPPADRVSCEAFNPPPYCDVGFGFTRFRAGSSLVLASVWNRLRFGWGEEIYVEIFPADDGALHARVFGAQTYFFEGRSELAAVCALFGVNDDLTGVVRLSPGALDDPSNAHGTLEADGTAVDGTPVHLSVAF